MKKNISAILFALAIIIAAFILGNAVINRNRPQGTINVTGLGESNFTSDLIVWEGNFSRESKDLTSAYSDLESDKKAVTAYLKSKGIPENQLIFNAVSTSPQYQQNYSNDGRFLGQTFTGYQLNQSLKIESKEVKKVEKISREITELLNQGMEDAPSESQKTPKVALVISSQQIWVSSRLPAKTPVKIILGVAHSTPLTKTKQLPLP